MGDEFVFCSCGQKLAADSWECPRCGAKTGKRPEDRKETTGVSEFS